MRIAPEMAERLVPDFENEVRRARLHSGRLARLLTSIAGASAIVFGRRIFLATSAAVAVESDVAAAAELLAHELTHVRQYGRYGMAAFLGRYVGEYLAGRLDGASHRDAYLGISFEREAERATRIL
jgi:Domain of unknown function (DUF4157)